MVHMNPTLLKALAALAPICMLLVGAKSCLLERSELRLPCNCSVPQGMMMVLLTHLCETFQLFPWMHWGKENSIGHYLDLSSAILAVTLFPFGYLLHALARRRR